MTISPEIQGDVLNYAAFLAGQLLFLLKRAGSAIRNPATKINTRWQFFAQNWDTFGIRAAMEFPFFYGYRHYGLATLTGWLGWTPPAWFAVPDNPIVAFFLGYAADSMLDWISMSPKLPAFLRSWIGENVPKLDAAVKLQKTLNEAADAVEVAGEKVAKAQEIAPVVKPGK